MIGGTRVTLEASGKHAVLETKTDRREKHSSVEGAGDRLEHESRREHGSRRGRRVLRGLEFAHHRLLS